MPRATGAECESLSVRFALDHRRLNANHYDSQLREMDANVTDCNKWNDPGQRASNEYHRHNGMNQRNSYNLNGTNLMRLHPMNMGNEAQPAEGFLGLIGKRTI